MQGNTATRTVVALMILIVLTCVVAVAQQPKNLTRPDVFAIFNGPREPFEALMKDVNAALANNSLNPMRGSFTALGCLGARWKRLSVRISRRRPNCGNMR
jgi:hypothetical protein